MTDRPRSLVFDQIAEEYDDTRGGEERGQFMAAALARRLPDTGTVLELGVGTGLVALGLARLGYNVVGVDLSLRMLQQARRRLGNRVAVADAMRLPLAPSSIPAAYAVWVLHVVADARAVLGELARVLNPDGLLLVVPGVPTANRTDLEELVRPMLDFVRPRGDDIDRIRDLGEDAGLRLSEQGELTTQPYELTPRQMADHVERRIYSALWDVNEQTWRRYVEPVIAQLRALPDPDTPRRAQNTYPLLVLRRI